MPLSEKQFQLTPSTPFLKLDEINCWRGMLTKTVFIFIIPF